VWPWRKFSEVPPLQSGYPLDFGERGQWFVARPRVATNLATNPSLETSTTSYTSVSSTLARVSALSPNTRQRRGAFCLEASIPTGPNWGAYYNGFSLTSGTTYFLSFDFFGDPGYAYQTYIADNAGNRLSPIKNFTATGEWQRVWFPYPAGATGTHRLYILQPLTGTTTNLFYVDGIQIEATRLTDYFDGDSRGWVNDRADFYWTGTPHASTSVRIADCRAGGERVSLKDLGFRVLAVIGGGLGGIVNQVTPLALGGAFYDDTTFAAKPLTLVGALMASGLGELGSIRDALTRLFAPDGVTVPQPFLLYYQPTDERGREAGSTLEMRAVYQGGLEGNLDNVNQERLALSFLLIDRMPFLDEGEHGAELYLRNNLSASYIMIRSSAGIWSAMGGNLTGGYPIAILRGGDGKIYVAGQFTDAGGVGATRGIARWTGTAWETVGGGLDNGAVAAMVMGPDGSIYIGGNFTSVAGVANTSRIARFNGSTWVSIATTIDSSVEALAFDNLGNLYVGGFFTGIDGVGNTNRIAYYNGVWNAMGTGSSTGHVGALQIMPDGDVIAGGSFTLMGGVANTVRIARWDGAAWNALSTGANGTVNALAIDAVGRLYAGGQFTTMGGVTVNYIALWNGLAWSAMGSGVDNYVRDLEFDAEGLLHVLGNFSLVDGTLGFQNYALWSGLAWLPPDVYPSPSTGYFVIFIDPFTGEVYVGHDNTGAEIVARPLRNETNGAVDYEGTQPTGFRVRITGPGTLRQVRNYTTGQVMYFNFALQSGETALLDFSNPAQLTFKSNLRDLLTEIMPGSDAALQLHPGDNSIAVFLPVTTDGNTETALIWRDAHHALDAAWTTNLLGS